MFEYPQCCWSMPQYQIPIECVHNLAMIGATMDLAPIDYYSKSQCQMIQVSNECKLTVAKSVEGNLGAGLILATRPMRSILPI